MSKNITNGQFTLEIDKEYYVKEDYKFIRVPITDNLSQLRHQQSGQMQYYIQNIRTGQFTQISENYIAQSDLYKSKDQQQLYTTDSFQTQMKMLKIGFEEKLAKAITFFQGLFAGMALLFTITLNLSQSVSQDLVRVEDQSIRIISLLSSFGALHALINSKSKYDDIKLKGSANQIDHYYKCFILCIIEFIFYCSSYIIFNISHQNSVVFNILGINYQILSSQTTAYTVLVLIGWIITNINTYKYQ